ncbi:MAG TPA: hypothetical protein DC054_22885 [Blastocatellia bacterium]|nr:hypothetical protein [Blastocatellia bacterium]
MQRVLPQLQKIYLELFRKGLLLRGALVDGRLRTEPRLEGNNFRKFLPKNDTLARAVGLEKTHKGARLLISGKLAEYLLREIRDWLTVDGYIRNAHPEVETTSMLRRICPTPTGIAYELLCFWDTGLPLSDYAAEKSTMKEIGEFVDSDTATHYHETIGLLERSELRDLRTRSLLSTL